MGALIMIVGVILMIIIHEGGHFVAAKAFGMKATEAFFGFGPRLWSTTRGETEYGVKAIPFGGYVRIIGMNPFEEIDPSEEGRTYRVAPYWKKTVVVLAGVVSHFIVALVLLWLVGVVWGTIAFDDDGQVIRSTTIAAVSSTVPGTSTPSPAEQSGILVGDVLVSTDGMPVDRWEEFTAFARDNGGRLVVIGVDRNGEALDLPATLAIVERPVFDENGEPITDASGEPVVEEAGFFGVTPEALREDQGIIGMIPVALSQFGEAAVASIRGLWELVIGFPELVASLFGGNDEILDTVRPISPIGLVQLAGPAESTLQLLALVNIFVGILNFVPLYPLDGGHFSVATYEKVTGRVPNVQKLVPVAAVVFIFLVSLGLMGVYLDIVKPL
ncbi:MAG: site-2 protease family protein [Acidimicrobiia bacterium]